MDASVSGDEWRPNSAHCSFPLPSWEALVLTCAACIVFLLCCTNAFASALGDETMPVSCERDVWQLSKLHCTWRDMWTGGIGPQDVTTPNARACRRRTRCIAASDCAPILLMEREVVETHHEERETSSCT